MTVPRQPANQPVELRPRPLAGDVVVNVDAQLVVKVVLNCLAMPFDQRGKATGPPGASAMLATMKC